MKRLLLTTATALLLLGSSGAVVADETQNQEVLESASPSSETDSQSRPNAQEQSYPYTIDEGSGHSLGGDGICPNQTPMT